MEYLKRTWKNKLSALALIGIGLLALAVENDLTVLVLCSVMALPLMLAKKSFFYGDEEDGE